MFTSIPLLAISGTPQLQTLNAIVLFFKHNSPFTGNRNTHSTACRTYTQAGCLANLRISREQVQTRLEHYNS